MLAVALAHPIRAALAAGGRAVAESSTVAVAWRSGLRLEVFFGAKAKQVVSLGIRSYVCHSSVILSVVLKVFLDVKHDTRVVI